MKILILTTALNRSDLHRQSFYSLRNVLNKSDDIIWVINIDAFDILRERVKKTKSIIKDIFKDYKNITFKFNKFNGGNFVKSVKLLAKEASEHIDNVDYVFYWEDDYVAANRKPLDLNQYIKRKIGSDFLSEDYIVNLTLRRKPKGKKAFCFQPSVWSPAMFKGFIKAFNDLDENYEGCPEEYLSDNFRDYNDILEYQINHYKVFAGYLVGRRWMKQRGLTKRNNDYIIEADESNTFTVAGYKHSVDKVINHRYDKYYSLFLPPDPEKKGSILEIGVDEGKSLRMWREVYPKVSIFGADIDLEYEEDNLKVYKVDQSSKKQVRALAKELPKLFFINDDGSHIPEHQLLCFNQLFPLLGNNGIYMIEDIEVSYWKRGRIYDYLTRYGYKHRKSIIEIFKDVADGVNHHIHGGVKTSLVKHQEYIDSITFGRNCIIIRKKFPEYVNYNFKENV